MIIYYTHDYNKKRKGESHRLLEQAVAGYLVSTRQDSLTGQKAHEEASRLVSSIRMTGEYGKPYIPGFAPFSISHSENTWAVLIAADAEGAGQVRNYSTGTCGLDVQYSRKADEESVAKRFFAPEDAEYIAGLPASERTDAFFRLWARREAIVKAEGSSAADSEVPSVRDDTAEYRGVLYRLKDIGIPDCSAYAAICLPACVGSAGKLTFQELLQETGAAGTDI